VGALLTAARAGARAGAHMGRGGGAPAHTGVCPRGRAPRVCGARADGRGGAWGGVPFLLTPQKLAP